jgi:hypothetical protein
MAATDPVTDPVQEMHSEAALSKGRFAKRKMTSAMRMWN